MCPRLSAKTRRNTIPPPPPIIIFALHEHQMRHIFVSLRCEGGKERAKSTTRSVETIWGIVFAGLVCRFVTTKIQHEQMSIRISHNYDSPHCARVSLRATRSEDSQKRDDLIWTFTGNCKRCSVLIITPQPTVLNSVSAHSEYQLLQIMSLRKKFQLNQKSLAAAAHSFFPPFFSPLLQPDGLKISFD